MVAARTVPAQLCVFAVLDSLAGPTEMFFTHGTTFSSLSDSLRLTVTVPQVKQWMYMSYDKGRNSS